MTADHCDGCPFVPVCPDCRYRGGVEPQRDSRSARWIEGGADGKVEPEQGAAPGRCVNTAEGLTMTRLPTRPGGIVAEAIVPTHPTPREINAQIGLVR